MSRKPFVIRLLVLPGSPQQRQVANVRVEPEQACEERAAVERFDRPLVRPHARPIDVAIRVRMLHHGIVSAIHVAAQSGRGRAAGLGVPAGAAAEPCTTRATGADTPQIRADSASDPRARRAAPR